MVFNQYFKKTSFNLFLLLLGNTQNQMNMSANSNWTIPGQYTEWGKQVIFTEEIGFLATSEKVTVF